ncbi:MAG TPA: hypothetical protein VEZ48_09250 [Sphingomonadaceae bacterium]|nr:hypothetical protein [Sphingomonadaceae bacterium]
MPVDRFADCLAFYEEVFEAEVVALSSKVANVFVFGAQITFHDQAHSPMTAAARQSMHFGAVVSPGEWTRLHQRIVGSGHSLLRCVEAREAPGGRAKLLIADPGGNLVEVNASAP